MERTVHGRKGVLTWKSNPHPGYLPYQAQPTHFPKVHNRQPYPPTLIWVSRLGDWYPQHSADINLPWSPSYPYPSLPYLSTLPFLPFLTLPYPKEIPCPINLWENTLPYLECLFNLPHPPHLTLHAFAHLTSPNKNIYAI